jgi:hypothetical protein
MIVYSAEITLVRENPNKIWFSAHLFVTLQPIIYESER